MKSILIFLSAVLLTACEPEKKRILYSSSVSGNSEIYLMKLDGSKKTALTQTPEDEFGAVWVSPNEISFLRQKEEAIDRVLMNVDDRSETLLSHPDACILDDKNAVFQKQTGDQLYPCNGDIFLLRSGEVTNLTLQLKGNANYMQWSPVGDAFIFTSNHNGSNDVYEMDITSRQIRALTQSPANNERGALSPDGERLAFSTDRFEKGNMDIAVKNLSSGEVIRMTNASGFDLIARWVDNHKLVIGSNSEGNWEIFLQDLTSRQLTRLTNNQAFDGDPRLY